MKNFRYLSLVFFFFFALQAMESVREKKEGSTTFFALASKSSSELVLEIYENCLGKTIALKEMTPSGGTPALSLVPFIKKTKKRISSYITACKEKKRFGGALESIALASLKEDLDILRPLLVTYFSVPSVFDAYQKQISLSYYLPYSCFDDFAPFKYALLENYPDDYLAPRFLEKNNLEVVLTLFLKSYHQQIVADKTPIGPQNLLTTTTLLLGMFTMCQGDLLMSPTIPSLLKKDYFHSHDYYYSYINILGLLVLYTTLITRYRDQKMLSLYKISTPFFALGNALLICVHKLFLNRFGYTVRALIDCPLQLYAIWRAFYGKICYPSNQKSICERLFRKNNWRPFSAIELLEETHQQLILLESYLKNLKAKQEALHEKCPLEISTIIIAYEDPIAALLAEKEKELAPKIKENSRKGSLLAVYKTKKIRLQQGLCFVFAAWLLFTHVISFWQTYVSFFYHKSP